MTTFDDKAEIIRSESYSAVRAGNRAAATHTQTKAILLLASAVNELAEQNRGVGVWRDCLLSIMRSWKRI